MTDERIAEIERSAYRGKPTMAGVLELCREVRRTREKATQAAAAAAESERQTHGCFDALRFVLDVHEAHGFRAKARAWFGRRLVLSLAP